MNRRQKLIQEQFINNEEAVIRRLKGVYSQSLKDINSKAKVLQNEINSLAIVIDAEQDAVKRATLKSMHQSKVYQKQYQDALMKQISSIIDNMQVEEFKTVSDYLKLCYEDGFIGTIFDLQGQGIPLCFPLNQEEMVQAVQADSKISQGLYTRLGEDVSILKKKITNEVSRGISTGMSFNQVAQQLAAYTNIGFNNAVRIARTEGHRIQTQATMNACYKAKEKGCDIVKQWDSTLDGKTRKSHTKVDGEVRELDEAFSNGLMFPGDPSGGAAEVIHCRCALLERARWALKNGFTKMNNFTKQLETFKSPEDYTEFKKAFFSKENRNYMKYIEQMQGKYGTKNFETLVSEMTEKDYDYFSALTAKNPIYNKKGLEKLSDGGIMRMGVVRDALESGKVSLNVKARQNLHIKGSEIFKEGRSYLKNGIDAQKLIDELKGTGEPIFDSNGDWTNKERVVCSEYVGIYVDGATGKESPTKNLTIIYSKDGCHVVPRRSDE